MKELSIEEKAKRYDEAYKVAKNIHIFSSDLAEIKRMEEIFPELKEESEDERIKKKICKILWDNAPYEEAQEYIAWLEKQNGQKPVIEMKTVSESLGFTTKKECDDYNKMVTDLIMSDDGKGEQKPANRVKPKYKVGDWVVSPNGVYWHIDAIRDGRYQVSSNSGYSADWSLFANIYHRFTIQDAKPGDVLVASDKSLFIYDGSINENGSVGFHIAFAKDTDIILNSDDGCGWEEKDSCHPATKEQRDQLEKAMADAGYTFDFEKKELKKIEQKPAWSKEDESMLNFVKVVLNKHKNDAFFDKFETTLNDCLTWFRNIKSRVGCEVNCTTTKEWKPSDEQMDALQYVYRNCNPLPSDKLGWDSIRTLEFMYQDLKKLREE